MAPFSYDLAALQNSIGIPNGVSSCGLSFEPESRIVLAAIMLHAVEGRPKRLYWRRSTETRYTLVAAPQEKESVTDGLILTNRCILYNLHVIGPQGSIYGTDFVGLYKYNTITGTNTLVMSEADLSRHARNRCWISNNLSVHPSSQHRIYSKIGIEIPHSDGDSHVEYYIAEIDLEFKTFNKITQITTAFY